MDHVVDWPQVPKILTLETPSTEHAVNVEIHALWRTLRVKIEGGNGAPLVPRLKQEKKTLGFYLKKHDKVYK